MSDIITTIVSPPNLVNTIVSAPAVINTVIVTGPQGPKGADGASGLNGISDVPGLTAALAGKAALVHTHILDDLTDLNGAVFSSGTF
jgi:hypothetical protein